MSEPVSPRLVISYGGTLRFCWYDSAADARRHFGKDRDLVKFDCKINDRDYWASARKFLEWVAQADQSGWREPFSAKVAYKKLRRIRCEEQRRAWDEVLPKEIVQWANERIAADIKGNEAECVDNDRCARLGNSSQMRRYRSAQANGCCGFADWVEFGPDGKRYALGYNFGH